MSDEAGRWITQNVAGFDDEAPPENALIAEGTDYEDNYFGESILFANMGMPAPGAAGIAAGTIAPEAWQIVSSFQEDPSIMGAVEAFGATTDIVGQVAADPFGFVGGQIAGWMLEHVDPIRLAFDALLGNPGMIAAYAGTWEKIAQELTTIGADWQTAVTTDIAEWSGLAATAYRTFAVDAVDRLGAAAGAAAALQTIMTKTGEIVEAVRGLVQAILGSLAAALITWTIELAFSAGTAAPIVAGQAAAQIAGSTSRVSVLVQRLTDVLKDIEPYKEALKSVLFTLTDADEIIGDWQGKATGFVQDQVGGILPA
ncbi:hypothetical protein HGA13_16405 [Nocardia speluncae]|uniref:Uncharacterized protein n=1 Tax=Nocardia speluncae TaxID=419477 RepID=A0A846XLM5_9NOCA|nr:hypothetical protein [Nocardia speluncae]NKY34644.1 hypothetical protein [Nocardia speluncae]